MKITVFLGSRYGNDGKYTELAEAIGTMIAENGHTLIYGGASNGLMGVLADSTLKHNGTVIGIITELLKGREIDHHGLSSLTVTKTMAERKELLIQEGDMYIALPGGIGTLEEAVDVISTLRTHKSSKKLLLMNTDGFYEPFRILLDKMCEEGFLSPGEISSVCFVRDTEELQTYLQ